MKLYFLLAVMLFTFACKTCFAEESIMLLVNKLDWKKITYGLPIEKPHKLKSGTGKTKQVWSIKKSELGNFEVIGNNQNDADDIGWQCMEHDSNGAAIKDVRTGTLCYGFFIKVLQSLVNKPEVLATKLLESAKKTYPQSAIAEYGDISIETDGEFYFLRRISRL